jgi:hypothetical protein
VKSRRSFIDSKREVFLGGFVHRFVCSFDHFGLLKLSLFEPLAFLLRQFLVSAGQGELLAFDARFLLGLLWFGSLRNAGERRSGRVWSSD